MLSKLLSICIFNRKTLLENVHTDFQIGCLNRVSAYKIIKMMKQYKICMILKKGWQKHVKR